jgi:hypothetical protein
MGIPKRQLGTTGVEVTILGLGGEGILRTHGYEREAYALINRARRPVRPAAHVLQTVDLSEATSFTPIFMSNKPHNSS